MILSISSQNLKSYVASQLNNFYPDGANVKSGTFDEIIDTAIDRVDYCFQRVCYERYNANGQTKLSHLYADQYLVFIWFLANTMWREQKDLSICNKLYYLNKSLHAFDCMYDTGLPDVFLIFHGAGTMLGKAEYSNYFVALQGCTVGSHKGKYPVMGEGVALAAHSSIIGDCKIGNRVTISANTSLYQNDVPSNSIVYRDSTTSMLNTKPTLSSYSQSFFNVEIPHS